MSVPKWFSLLPFHFALVLQRLQLYQNLKLTAVATHHAGTKLNDCMCIDSEPKFSLYTLSLFHSVNWDHVPHATKHELNLASRICQKCLQY